MTPEQMDRIDALVAEKVMGWKRGKPGINAGRWVDAEGRDMGWNVGNTAFSPTRDGNAMLEVKQKFTDFATEKCGEHWYACADGAFNADGETEPLAVALAALKAGSMYQRCSCLPQRSITNTSDGRRK